MSTAGPLEPTDGPPGAAAGAADGADVIDETGAGVADGATPSPAGSGMGAGPEPTTRLKNLWAWAKGYVAQFDWALAPVWLTADLVPGGLPGGIRVGCCCKDGEACTAWGKHLVSGLGTARDEGEVELTWPTTNPQVMAGHIGIAVLTGAESKLLVLDVGSGSAITRARFKMAGHVLTQSTPSGGEHWFFKLGEGVSVYGGRREIELGPGLTVLGDGTFVVVGPRRGYSWAGGADVLKTHGLTKLPAELELALARDKLIKPTTDIHPDDMWRTTPGNPLSSSALSPRTYTRLGDVRRLVDQHGDKITYTPGFGFRVWGGNGWGDPEASEQALKSYASRLPEQHRAEADEYGKKGADSEKKNALKWSRQSSQRSTASLLSDLNADDRIYVPSTDHWDSEGWIAGLPVVGGIGRLVNLRTGKIERDAVTRRVSRTLGADYVEGVAGSLKVLWDHGVAGGPGRFFVKYLTDLQSIHGPEWVRLLQRAAGASLYGRRGVGGDVDAVFVLKGPARSGKSTFAECLLAVSGTYGKALSHNMLFGDKGNPEFSDAAIMGYRVLTFSEPPLKAALNTTKLKSLSGGDTITGRPPYGRSEVSFQPECSLWLSTNHALEVADDALWRRMKFFRFQHSWEGSAEWPELRRAVTQDADELRLALAWMLQGAVAWAAEGWGDTTLWSNVTDDERTKHDVKVKWADDKLVVTGSATDEFTGGDMMANFAGWLVMSGENPPPLSKVALRDELEHMLTRMGVTWNQYRKRFQGAQLM